MADPLSADLAQLGRAEGLLDSDAVQERQELRRDLQRRHRHALRDGAPEVPKGYFWESRQGNGYALLREVEKPGRGFHTRIVGILDSNGWEQMSNDPADALDFSGQGIPPGDINDEFITRGNEGISGSGSDAGRGDAGRGFRSDASDREAASVSGKTLRSNPQLSEEIENEKERKNSADRDSDRTVGSSGNSGGSGAGQNLAGNQPEGNREMADHAPTVKVNSHSESTSDYSSKAKVTGHSKAKILDFKKDGRKVNSHSGGSKWKKSRVKPGFLIRRIKGYDIVESEYGVSYLFVVTRKPSKVTSGDCSLYEHAGFNTWKTMEMTGRLKKGESNGRTERIAGNRARAS